MEPVQATAGAPHPQLNDLDLSGARVTRCNFSGAQFRAVDMDGASIDAPWLGHGSGTLLVNDVDVAGFVEQELDRRFPGRALRRATTPGELHTAWQAMERQWEVALGLAETLLEGAVHLQVDGEWSFSQTLRHLVMATDTWFGRGIQGQDLASAYHPIGLPNHEFALDGYDTSVFSEPDPDYLRVLEVRAGRQQQVGTFISQLDDEQLTATREHPWAPGHPVTVGSCLRTVLHEEWEHLRFAVRDLAALGNSGLDRK